jgi:hypothetical protein
MFHIREGSGLKTEHLGYQTGLRRSYLTIAATDVENKTI